MDVELFQHLLNHQFKILYPLQLSFKSERNIKTFLDKQKLNEFANHETAVEEMLNDVLQKEGK